MKNIFFYIEYISISTNSTTQFRFCVSNHNLYNLFNPSPNKLIKFAIVDQNSNEKIGKFIDSPTKITCQFRRDFFTIHNGTEIITGNVRKIYLT